MSSAHSYPHDHPRPPHSNIFKLIENIFKLIENIFIHPPSIQSYSKFLYERTNEQIYKYLYGLVSAYFNRINKRRFAHLHWLDVEGKMLFSPEFSLSHPKPTPHSKVIYPTHILLTAVLLKVFSDYCAY